MGDGSCGGHWIAKDPMLNAEENYLIICMVLNFFQGTSTSLLNYLKVKVMDLAIVFNFFD